MDINGSTEVVFNNYDPENIKFLVSFDFVGAICILANSFHNCIIYTVRSPRFKVIRGQTSVDKDSEFPDSSVVSQGWQIVDEFFEKIVDYSNFGLVDEFCLIFDEFR